MRWWKGSAATRKEEASAAEAGGRAASMWALMGMGCVYVCVSFLVRGRGLTSGRWNGLCICIERDGHTLMSVHTYAYTIASSLAHLRRQLVVRLEHIEGHRLQMPVRLAVVVAGGGRSC